MQKFIRIGERNGIIWKIPLHVFQPIVVFVKHFSGGSTPLYWTKIINLRSRPLREAHCVYLSPTYMDSIYYALGSVFLCHPVQMRCAERHLNLDIKAFNLQKGAIRIFKNLVSPLQTFFLKQLTGNKYVPYVDKQLAIAVMTEDSWTICT